MSAASLSPRVAIALVVSAVALAPSGAEAHLVTTGLGPFYDGMSHFALSPEDVLPVAALGILAGLRGKEQGRHAFVALPLAWLTGGIAGLALKTTIAIPAWLPLIVLGGLVAADWRLPIRLTTAIAALLGLACGFLNGAALAEVGQGVVALLGIVTVVFIAMTLVTSSVLLLRAGWPRLAARIAGSWIAASGLLLLGWSFR
jgi:urease accessory protein